MSAKLWWVGNPQPRQSWCYDHSPLPGTRYHGGPLFYLLRGGPDIHASRLWMLCRAVGGPERRCAQRSPGTPCWTALLLTGPDGTPALIRVTGLTSSPFLPPCSNTYTPHPNRQTYQLSCHGDKIVNISVGCS